MIGCEEKLVRKNSTHENLFGGERSIGLVLCLVQVLTVAFSMTKLCKRVRHVDLLHKLL